MTFRGKIGLSKISCKKLLRTIFIVAVFYKVGEIVVACRNGNKMIDLRVGK